MYTMINHKLRRRRRPPFINNSNRIRKQSVLILCLLLQLLSITSANSIDDNEEQLHQRSNNNNIAPDKRKLQTLLNLGSIECASCSGLNQQCSGTTIQDMHCLPCSSGQAWWPCNIANECYCKDISTDNPTSSPVKKQDETNRPSSSMAPTIDYQNIARPGSSSSGSTSGGSSPTGIVDAQQQQQQQQYEIPKSSIDPQILQGLYVMDAHLSANKIVLTRELLSSPGSSSTDDDNNFSYISFRNSLHTMITTGISNSTFYIGEPSNSNNKINGRVYGLVNIATFLSQSYESSIKYNSCDEINMDVVDGYLPISNACGQYGINYQTFDGNECDRKYACEVDLNMRMNANEATASSTRNEGDNNNDPAKPFYCAPKSDYGGLTGYWDYISSTEIKSPAVVNSVNRKDVQGCCWWGRGSLSLRGTCSYGKLNYYLGKRAHDEGRPSLYPDIDFCTNPHAICSNNRQHPDLKWIAGMFRWITVIQTYNKGGFNYMQELINFVDSGLQDMSFIHGVSGIVTQGCHDPPCANKGGEFNGATRKATFIKTLRILGLKVNDGTASQ